VTATARGCAGVAAGGGSAYSLGFENGFFSGWLHALTRSRKKTMNDE
jgi:hypothetical protein